MPDSTDLTCREFVAKLSSKSPTPGGGGAAALVGAVGVALGNMVSALTVGKPRYADVESEVLELMREADSLQDLLLDLVEADALAFEPVARAYKLPSDTENQRSHKTEVMEAALHGAVEAPLRIMAACCDAIGLHGRLAKVGASIAISDVGCGVICCKAALKAASLNVLVNTKAMTDGEFACTCNDRAQDMLQEGCAKADAIFVEVEGRLS